MMSMINALLDEIDELNNKKVTEKTKIKSRIRELEEDKKRAGFRGDRSSVLKITRQIKNLQNESGHRFDYEIKNCERKINEIIVDYYENNFTINDIFLEENIPKNIQEEWLEKSDFGENTGYLYVEKIREGEYYWRYYNPFLEIEFKAETLKSLKNKVESQGEKLIGFDEVLVKKSEYRDSHKYQVIIDEKIDRLDSYQSWFSNRDRIKILEELSNSEFPLTKEQVTRLYHNSMNFYLYDCFYCFLYLSKIVEKNEDVIDKDLLEGINNMKKIYYRKKNIIEKSDEI